MAQSQDRGVDSNAPRGAALSVSCGVVAPQFNVFHTLQFNSSMAIDIADTLTQIKKAGITLTPNVMAMFRQIESFAPESL